jgi:hypothetical protein
VLFVSLGLGSVIVSTFEFAPWLIVVSRHKTLLFAVVGVMLGFNYWFAIVRPRRLNCAPGEVCHIDSPTMRASRIMFWTSVVVWMGAVVFNYLALWWVRLALLVLLVSLPATAAFASGHGPVFGTATPTLGRGGWSLDQAWTIRTGEEDQRQQMLKTMLSFGVTENIQLSGSVPLVMGDANLAPARMMSAMSNDREFEGLLAYRFQRRTVGIGGRQESTFYIGGTAPFESRRNGIGVGPSIEGGISTGYASRAHYVWVGGALQHYAERGGDRVSDSRLVTAVYGYRPPALRTEAGKPDLRFFVEMTAEDRGSGARTVFVGPTSLLLHKAIAIEGGVLFPAYQRIDSASSRERMRIAVNVAYFFWLK